MVKRTVLKVNISCGKCKQQLIQSVSALEGVDKIEVDAAKGTMTITGDADPIEIITRTKKTKKFVEVLTVGPPLPSPSSSSTFWKSSSSDDKNKHSGSEAADDRHRSDDQKNKKQSIVRLEDDRDTERKTIIGAGKRLDNDDDHNTTTSETVTYTKQQRSHDYRFYPQPSPANNHPMVYSMHPPPVYGYYPAVRHDQHHYSYPVQQEIVEQQPVDPCSIM